jgi:hypothetical protein
VIIRQTSQHVTGLYVGAPVSSPMTLSASYRVPVVLLVGLLLASGCVASGGSRYRPCHELRTDMSISNDEFEYHCPRYRSE